MILIQKKDRDKIFDLKRILEEEGQEVKLGIAKDIEQAKKQIPDVSVKFTIMFM